MAEQANRMMIGGFVVIAVFLLAASIVIFGSGKFFKQTDNYLLHFDGSIKGLNVGAPVLFQGVQIGSVTRITLRADQENMNLDIPIIIEIDPDRFHVVGNEVKQPHPREALEKLINMGLRASLTIQSIITGQLLIELDFYPDSPIYLKETEPDYPEIPTIQSPTKRLFQTLQNIDFESMAKHLEETMSGIDRLVNNPDLLEGISSLKLAIDELREVIGKVDYEVDTMAETFGGTLQDARSLMNKVNHQVDPLAADLKKGLENFEMLTRHADEKLGELANDLNRSLSGFRGILSEDAPLIIKLEETLRDISAMATYMRQLADYLERHPEALIQGKREPGE